MGHETHIANKKDCSASVPRDQANVPHDPANVLHDGDDIDRGHAWVVLGATYATFFVIGSFLHTSGIVHTALLDKFRQPVAQTAWAGSLFTAATSLASPVGSAIVDRYSCRVAVMVGGVMATVGFLLTGLAPNVQFCVFSYGLVAGTGGGIIYGVVFVVNGFNFKRRLNLAQGISCSGVGVGLFLMAPLFEACKAEFGFTGFCFILAGIAMQMVVFGALMRPSSLELKLKSLRNPIKIKRRETSVIESIRDQVNIYGRGLCHGYIILLSISMFFFCGGIYTLFLYWPNFCRHQGFTAIQSSITLSVVGFVSIGGRFFAGILASSRHLGERVVYSGSLTIFGTSLILFFLYSARFSGHVTLAGIVGVVSGAALVVTPSLTAKGSGVQFLASAVGMEFMFGGVGTIAIPVMSGYMIQGGASFDMVFAVCGFCLLIAAALGFGTKFVKKHTDEVTYVFEMKVESEREGFIVKKHADEVTCVFEMKVESEREGFIAKKHADEVTCVFEMKVESEREGFIVKKHADEVTCVFEMNAESEREGFIAKKHADEVTCVFEMKVESEREGFIVKTDDEKNGKDALHAIESRDIEDLS